MSRTGTYVIRGGKAVKISDRTPALRITNPHAKTQGQHLLADWRDYENRHGSLPDKPGGFTIEQIKHAATLPDV